MKLDEVTSLISIRQYVVNSIANGSIDRATVNVMNGMLILIDNKILSILQSDVFKDYVGYKDAVFNGTSKIDYPGYGAVESGSPDIGITENRKSK